MVISIIYLFIQDDDRIYCLIFINVGQFLLWLHGYYYIV